MKIFCYFVLIVGFLIFYQQEPVFSLVIVSIAAGSYIFFKVKKKGSRGASSGFFYSGNKHSSLNKVDNLVDLILVQQLLTDNFIKIGSNKKQEEKEQEIEKIKNEVLDLFEDF